MKRKGIGVVSIYVGEGVFLSFLFHLMLAINESKRYRLKQHLQGVLNESLERVQELGSNGTVDGTVVRAEGDGHDVGSAVLAILGTGENTLLGGTDGHDARLWGVDDGCELLDAHHAHVGDGEGATLVLVGGELVGTSTGDEILDLVRDGGQALGVGVGDNGGDQAGGGRGGDANVGGVVPIVFQKDRRISTAIDLMVRKSHVKIRTYCLMESFIQELLASGTALRARAEALTIKSLTDNLYLSSEDLLRTSRSFMTLSISSSTVT